MEQENKIIVSSTLDTIPEDAVLAIVQFVNKWAEVRGIEKSLGRRSRNSTLRAVSLTSRKAFNLWYTPLIESVTVNSVTLVSLYRLLVGDRRMHVKTIKALRCTEVTNQTVMDEESFHDLINFANIPPSNFSAMDRLKALKEGIRRLSGIIISQLSNLSTLIVEDHRLLPSKFSSLSPSTRFIKKLCLEMSDHTFESSPTSARNVIWLLVFCESLEAACIGFTVSKQDFEFLDEYKTIFNGLSNVKRLALGPRFIWDLEDKRSWWGSANEKKKKWIGGSKKTMAIHNLFLVTEGLTSLEFTEFEKERSPNDETMVYSSCLMSLSKSFHSLKHLRFNHPQADLQDPHSTQYNLFKTLKIFKVDRFSLSFLLENPTAQLPLSIELIYVMCYITGISTHPDNLSEERDLVLLLKSRSFPELKEVIVPTALVGLDGTSGGDAEERVIWARNRKNLEAFELFKEGKVKLIKEKPGPFTRINAEDEFCPSTVRWISPWG